MKKHLIERNKFFDPGTAFFKLPIVWWTVGIISLFSGCLVLWIITGGGPAISVNRNYERFNDLVSIFKVPLGLLALLIPILAVYATNHRSEQSVEAMRLTRSQNNFANYYKHLEEFLKHLYQFENYSQFSVKGRKLHKLLFPNVLEGDFSPNQLFLTDIAKRLNSLFQLTHRSTLPASPSVLDLDKFRCEYDGVQITIEELLNGTKNILNQYVTPLSSSLNWFWVELSSDFDFIREHYGELIIDNCKIVRLLNHAVSFDAGYSSPLDEVEVQFSRVMIFPDVNEA